MNRSSSGFSTKCPIFIFSVGFIANEKYLSTLKVNKESHHSHCCDIAILPFGLQPVIAQTEKLFSFPRGTRNGP